MSIQSLISQLANIDREILNIQGQIHSIDLNILRKQKEATSINERISREKDFKRAITYQKDLARKHEEISRSEKDRSSKSKSLADKQQKKYTLQQSLTKEEQKERDNTKREQKEILSAQQQITREMERQKSLVINSVSVSHVIENRTYDVFVSHASEDKEDFVRPFANALKTKGLVVWYDEFELRVGDSLRRSIDSGLSNSKYGIVVLSESFFKKEWPQRELDGLFAREVNGAKVILPIWHKISKDEVVKFSPIIADLLALNTATFTIDEIAAQISERISRK